MTIGHHIESMKQKEIPIDDPWIIYQPKVTKFIIKERMSVYKLSLGWRMIMWWIMARKAKGNSL